VADIVEIKGDTMQVLDPDLIKKRSPEDR